MASEYDGQVLEKIRDFFSSCAMSDELAATQERIKGFTAQFSRVTGDRVKDIYATCLRDAEGKGIEVKDLFLFSERYIMVVDDLTADRTASRSFRLFSAKKRISFLKVTTENCEFDGEDRSFGEESRLKLEFATYDNVRLEREAWGPYCPRLARLIRQWVLPNLA